MQLYEALAVKVTDWRKQNYAHDDYPAIGEILEWAHQPDVPTFRLRAPQLRALETYWYLRLVEKTPHIFDLYTRLFERTTERLDALGMTHPDMRELALDYGFNGLIDKVRDDNEFVKQYKFSKSRICRSNDFSRFSASRNKGFFTCKRATEVATTIESVIY
jgi:hypothetical protein